MVYLGLKERRVREKISSRSFSGRPDEKSQLKIEIDENGRSKPGRCEMNMEEVESNKR